jgi:hypothetical protein
MSKKISVISLILLTLLVFVSLKITNSSKAQTSNEDLKLSLGVVQKSYLLGENVNLDLTLINRLPNTVLAPSVDNGYLQIWIASADQKFKEYRGSNWGNKDGGKAIKPGEISNNQITVLWNFVPALIRKEEDNLLETHYAFPEAGIYFIKATASFWNNNRKFVIESEPIQITVDDPVGDDLIIWNKIKENEELLFFMQQNKFLTSKPGEREKLQKEVERITAKYPNSVLANQMKKSLEKYQASEDQRK